MEQGSDDSILGGGGVVRPIVDISVCICWFSVHCGSCGVALWITSHKHIQEGSVPSFSISIVYLIEVLRQGLQEY